MEKKCESALKLGWYGRYGDLKFEPMCPLVCHDILGVLDTWVFIVGGGDQYWHIRRNMG